MRLWFSLGVWVLLDAFNKWSSWCSTGADHHISSAETSACFTAEQQVEGYISFLWSVQCIIHIDSAGYGLREASQLQCQTSWENGNVMHNCSGIGVVNTSHHVSVWLDFYPKWKLCSRWDFCDIRLPNLGQGHKGNSPHAPLDIPLGLLRVPIHSAVQRNLPKRGGNDVKRSPYWWLSPSYPN